MQKLETERLLLRHYEKKDKPDFIKLFTDKFVMRYVGEGVLTEAQAEAFWLKQLFFQKIIKPKLKNKQSPKLFVM